jgi:myo-inositol 2-dehydrogenase / D-chiro-inositol 1-dehydrogenase
MAAAAGAAGPARLLVVGLGRAGRIHASGAAAGAPTLALAGVVDVNVAVAKEFADAHGVPHFDSLAGAVAADAKAENGLFDAVVIATPTAEHVSDIQASLAAKKPVMCEKPISFAVEDIDSCYKAAQEANLPLLCAYQRRHDASFSAVAKSAQAGEIGTLHVVRSTSRDNPVPTQAYLAISGKVCFRWSPCRDLRCSSFGSFPPCFVFFCDSVC